MQAHLSVSINSLYMYICVCDWWNLRFVFCQVKQQRKKNNGVNKWRCVVCNQMQSVLKVFAQGFVAKDLRGFVQNFNMSRINGPPLPQSQPHQQQQQQQEITHDHTNNKRRSDWSQYLDSVEYKEERAAAASGGDFETKIVTELPEDLFKKQKLNAVGQGIYKPIFSKRNSATKNVAGRYQTIMAEGSSSSPSVNDDYYMKQDEQQQEPRTRTKPQLPAAKAKRDSISKWNHYITQDHNDDLQLGSARNFDEYWTNNDHTTLETITNDQEVEDDVHPDFM